MIYSRQGSVNSSVACLTFKKVRKKKEVGSFICGLFNDSLSSSNYTESMVEEMCISRTGCGR